MIPVRGSCMVRGNRYHAVFHGQGRYFVIDTAKADRFGNDEQPFEVEGKDEDVLSLRYTDDGAAVIAQSRSVKVFGTSQCAVLRKQPHDPQACVVSADGATVMTKTDRDCAQCFDTVTGAKRAYQPSRWAPTRDDPATLFELLLKPTVMVFAPNGKTIAISGPFPDVCLWSLERERSYVTITGHPQESQTNDARQFLLFAPDSATIATRTDELVITLWDVATGKRKRVLDHRKRTRAGSSGPVELVSFSADSAHVATILGHTVYVWRVSTGMCCKIAPIVVDKDVLQLKWSTYVDLGLGDLDITARVADHHALRGVTATVQISPDRTMIALPVHANKGGKLSLSDAVTGTRRHTLDCGSAFSLVSNSAFSPDSSMLAVCWGSSRIFVWDTAAGRCLFTVGGGLGARFTVVAFAPDGTSMASGCGDGRVHFWDVPRAGVPVQPASFVCGSPVAAARFDADGALIAVEEDGSERVLWQPSSHVPLCDVARSDLTLRQRLGGGTTSVVYATVFGGQPCAAKIYHPHVGHMDVARELAVTPMLRHPHIVTVLGCIVGTTHDVDGGATNQEAITGLLMERVPGSTLAAACRSSPDGVLPPAAAGWSARGKLRVCLRVAEGLSFAHGWRVIHSDVKDANVLLSSQTDADDGAPAEVKLADFGSAKVLATAGATTTLGGGLGTLAFMAPEFIESEQATTASDVFSLGMVIWAVFHPGVDIAPASAHSFKFLTARINGDRPPLGPDVPAAVAALIEACWATDPVRRPAVDDVVARLRKELDIASAAGAPAGNTAVVPTNAIANTPALGSFVTKLLLSRHRSLYFGSKSPCASAAGDFDAFVGSVMRPNATLDATAAGAALAAHVTRVVPVTDHPLTNTFLQHHECDSATIASNPVLRPANPTDADSVAALAKLKASFAAVSPGTPAHLRFSNIVYAWHGTAASRIDAVCRDGPRSLRTTDAGYFGAGSYFSLEAAYAARYSMFHPPNADSGEYGVILYALSVSRAVPITLRNHYRTPAEEGTVDPRLHGFSKFYSADASVAPALSPNCDAHFVPVRQCGKIHPVDNTTQLARTVDYQACPAARAEGHEIVLHSHLRSTPVAVVYFKRA